MLAFIIRRLLLMIPMVFLFSVVAFLIILAPPGDYLSEFAAQLAEETGMALEEEMLEFLRERYGLDDPIYIQYLKWIKGVVQWDFGRSLEYKRPVAELLNERLAMTVVLTSFFSIKNPRSCDFNRTALTAAVYCCLPIALSYTNSSFFTSLSTVSAVMRLASPLNLSM